MTKSNFSAVLKRPEGVGTWTYLSIPARVSKAFGTRGRVRVRGTIDGHAFQSSAMPDGDGSHFLVVNKTIRDAIGANQGSTVRVLMERDTVERKVEVPADFKKALAANAAAHQEFSAYPYSHQKELVDWIRAAKRAETRQRRITKALASLVK
jgi:hypothetical protein